MTVSNNRLAKAESALADHYATLAPSERFRLIVDAGGRGDAAEQTRVAEAGRRITLSVQDHQPFALALEGIWLLVIAELFNLAADYSDAFQQAIAAEPAAQADVEEEKKGAERKKIAADEEDPERVSTLDRLWHLVLAKGYKLRATFEGWGLFCERRGFLPYADWEDRPGWDRLRRALDLANRVAFTPEGFHRWANRIRQAEVSEVDELWVTSKSIADDLEKQYWNRAAALGGELPPSVTTMEDGR